MTLHIHSLQVGKVQKFENWETGSFKNEVDCIEITFDKILEDEVADKKITEDLIKLFLQIVLKTILTGANF